MWHSTTRVTTITPNIECTVERVSSLMIEELSALQNRYPDIKVMFAPVVGIDLNNYSHLPGTSPQQTLLNEINIKTNPIWLLKSTCWTIYLHHGRARWYTTTKDAGKWHIDITWRTPLWRSSQWLGCQCVGPSAALCLNIAPDVKNVFQVIYQLGNKKSL